MTDPRKALKRIRKQANSASVMIDLGPLSDKDWELCATAARVTVPALLDVLEAVLEIHKPIQSSITRRNGVDTITVCEHCLDPTWPCPTVTTITTALEGETHD